MNNCKYSFLPTSLKVSILQVHVSVLLLLIQKHSAERYAIIWVQLPKTPTFMRSNYGQWYWDCKASSLGFVSKSFKFDNDNYWPIQYRLLVEGTIVVWVPILLVGIFIINGSVHRCPQLMWRGSIQGVKTFAHHISNTSYLIFVWYL